MQTHVLDSATDFYNIQAKHSGLNLDVVGQRIHNEDNVAQWQQTGLDNQKWLLVAVPRERNTYHIIAKHSGLFLDVLGERIHNGDNVAQWQQTGLDNQKWILEPVQGGFYKLKAKHSGLNLDVVGQRIHNGDNVVQWQQTGLTNQEWKLIPAESIKIPAIPANKPRSFFEPKMESPDFPKSDQEGVTGVEWISCVFVKDDEIMPLAERLKKSPWYSLERTTAWVTDKDLWHYNSGRGMDKRTWTYRSSWTKETQTSFSVTTGVEATVGGDAFGGSVTSSLSFTSSFSESLSKTKEKEDSLEIEIPPGTAKALFRREETLTLKRMNGELVPGAEWKTYGGTATATFPDDE